MTQTGRRDSRPHMVVIVPHDLGQHLGCYGVPTVNSPNIDALAARGVRFTNSFCTAPSCSPSRASIFTGRYPHSNGMMGLSHADFAWEMHEDERHLAHLLAEAGYHTGLAGGAHELRLQDRGGHNERMPGSRADESVTSGLGFFRRNIPSGKPLFLELCCFEVHRGMVGFAGAGPDESKGIFVPPYLVDEISSREEFAVFQGCVRQLDTAVGRLIAGLDELGVLENTIVVMTADHGIPFPRAKCSLYDPGLVVPLILHWPGGGWTGGRTVDALVSNIDYVPTLLEAAGVAVPDTVQGRSLVPLLRGQRVPWRDAVFAELTWHDYYDPRRAIRTARWKLIVNFSCTAFFMDPSQSWRPKCVTRHPDNPAFSRHPLVELYDLEDNPLEENNLADDPTHAETRRKLLRRLQEWMETTGDPLLDGDVTSPMHARAVSVLINRP